ncbi:unnamed protein product [Merluccius merluccius]
MSFVLRSTSVVTLNDRFSQVLEAPALVTCEVKREPAVVGNHNVLRKSVKQRLGRINPGVQLGPRPQRVSLDSRPSVLRLRSGALDGWFLGRRRCPCALWGLRLASRRYGWAGQVLRARPLKRTGFKPKSWFTRQAEVPTKEKLDQQLDDYMSMSKRHLDAQLDAYRAMAGDQDGEDDEKWFDIDV